MATAPTALRTPAVLADRPVAGVQERTIKPIKWWAALGALFLAVMAWTYAQWIASGDVGPAPAGPTPIPESTLFWARFWEVIGVSGAVLAVWFFIVRPWRRTGQLSTDGMFVIIFFQLWAFQDAFVNYTVNQFQYNAAFVDIGSWYEYIPGWMAPGSGNLAEPILFVGGLYVWLFACGLILINGAMRKAKERWPQMGRLGLFGIAFAIAAVLDFVFEVTWLRQDLYSYGGHINEVTLWPSHQYAMPIYESVLWGITWGIYATLRYDRNDRGEMVAERGLSSLRIGAKRKQLLRFLALLGAVNLGMIVLYSAPYQLIGLWSDSIPKDVTEKSYLTTGVCGIGTDRACTPNDALPISVKPSQAYFTPTGELRTPSPIPVEPRAEGVPLVKKKGTGWP
jgi:Spirocyclase AveC-like